MENSQSGVFRCLQHVRMDVLYMSFVCARHLGIQQRGLVGWQVFDTHCGEQAGEGKCVWACPLHRHTAAVCSQPGRTRQRERNIYKEGKGWGRDGSFTGRARWVVHLGECVRVAAGDVCVCVCVCFRVNAWVFPVQPQCIKTRKNRDRTGFSCMLYQLLSSLQAGILLMTVMTLVFFCYCDTH